MSVTVKQIVDSQVHIGTLKSEAHPKLVIIGWIL